MKNVYCFYSSIGNLIGYLILTISIIWFDNVSYIKVFKNNKIIYIIK